MCGCIPLPSWAGGNARDDAPPTRRQERERYAEELRRERGLSTDEEERRLEERLAELEAKHAEALRAGDAGRLADLEGAIADLERKLEVDAAAYTPEPRKSFIPSLGSIGETNSFETPPPLHPQHSGETLDEVSGHVDARRSRQSRGSADE